MTTEVMEVTVTSRLLDPKEPVPYLDDVVWTVTTPDRNWIWVAVQDQQIIGCLVAAPVYPYVNLLRARMNEDAPSSALLVLLRQFFHDARQRTFQGMFSHFDFTEEAEKRLALCMVKFFGGKIFYNVTAPLPKED